MRRISFHADAFKDYQDWAISDKKIFSKINEIIKAIDREPFRGIGKPEPLKHELFSYWSRRITSQHRLVYKVEKDVILIASCKYHY